jgi:hypothetical protein
LSRLWSHLLPVVESSIRRHGAARQQAEPEQELKLYVELNPKSGAIGADGQRWC